MDIKINNLDGSKKEIHVTISVEEMEGYVKDKLESLSKEININGFRKGSAPKNIIENKVGKEKIFQEAAEDAIRITYPKIIEENSFFTITSPHIEISKCAPGNNLEYKAVVYVFPKIDLPDYKKIAEKTIENNKKQIEIKEEEVLKVLKMLQNMKAEKTSVTRKARKEDLVTINFKGVFDEKKDKKIEEENFQMILGEEGMNVLNGFEENIYNMTPNDKKEFTLEVPNISENNKKEKIIFSVELINIMERKLPQIDDTFAKLFNMQNLDEMKEQIKKDLLSEKETKEEEELKNNILQSILKETKIEVPKILIEKELDNMIMTVENQLKERNASLDDYLKEINKTIEEIRKSWEKQAEKNVAYALILHKISTDEGVTVSDKEIEEEVKKNLQFLGKKMEEETESNISRMKSYTHDVIKNQKIFNLLLIK